MLYVFAGKERAGNYDAREDPNWRNGLVRKGAPQSSGACTRLFSRQGLPGPSRDVSCSVKKTYLPAIVKEVRQPSSTYVVALQSLSRAQLFVTQWTVAHQASLSFTISRSFLKLMSTEFQWCHPTISSSVVPFSSCPQSFPASGSFPMSCPCIRWPKYWSFSFSISPSNEYSGLIDFL